MTDSDVAVRLARAALVALQAAAGAASVARRTSVVLLPEIRPVPWDDAISYLASLEKPLVLVGLLSNESLYIGGWSASATLQATAVEMVAQTLSDSQPSMAKEAPDVLVFGNDESYVEMSSAEFLQWVQDYCIPISSMELRAFQETDPVRCAFVASVGPAAGGYLNSI